MARAGDLPASTMLHRKNAWAWMGGMVLYPAVFLLGVASILNGVLK